MATSSTKSRAGKKQKGGAKQQARATADAQAPEQAEAEQVSRTVWLVGGISIMAVAAFLRLYDLNLVPLHHDEGVNGNFLVRLFREGYYRYDPQNYHGPTLYYFSLISTYIFGLNTFAIRLVTALFGLGTIWLVLLMRKHLGTFGSLAAAALLAVSPGAVYLSRYFIHESLFLFFTLGLLYAALRYYEDAHPVYLWLASASAALLFATKETAMITAGVFVIALVIVLVYTWLRKLIVGEKQDGGWVTQSSKTRQAGSARAATFGDEGRAEDGRELLARFGGPINVATFAVIALIVFIVVSILFYSSFFTNYPKGIADALETFKFWSRTGREAHVHPWYKYLIWLLQEEAPLLVLGALGALLAVVIALWRANNSVALFIALWAFGLLAAYSLVPYKTPWLTLNFIVPLAIIAGYGLGAIYSLGQHFRRQLPALGFTLMGLALALSLAAITVCGYQMYALNFEHYDDDQYPYVYAHTRREMLDLVDEVNRIAKRAGTNEQTGITIVSPDYWPLPWYFRDFKRVGYYGQMTATSEPVVIANENQEAQLQSSLNGNYRRVGSYVLRPGVTLVLYERVNVPR